MAARCEICGKGPQFGHNVSKALNRTKRRWLPNLQRTRVQVGRRSRRMRVCAECLRSLDRWIAEGRVTL